LDWFARWSRDRPDAPYLVTGPEVVDFATAHARITRYVGGLRHGRDPGTRVGVIMRPVREDLLLALAVPMAGMVLVPLPAAASEGERAVLAELAGVESVVGPADLDEQEFGRAAVDPDETWMAVFTTGTSGTPRAVRLTGRNIESSAAASASHLDHRSDDRWLAVLPMHHVGGLSILWRSARQGSAVVLAGPFDASRVASILADGQVTLASFVSPMLERLADEGIGRVEGFRYGLVGGGPASQRALGVGGMTLLPTYGMTETASQVATADPADPRPDRLVVLDGADVTIAADGRIVVDGPMVSPGDLDQPDRGGPLVTGDLGRLEARRLEVLGRVDDVIVTGGENVMPSRVERIASGIPGAGDVAVVGIPDPEWGSVVAAAYTGERTESELVEEMRRLVSSHEVPRRWRRVPVIPRLGIGKIDRKAVAALFD
jgi:O-succinylbenzoic acid--CoA ligase